MMKEKSANEIKPVDLRSKNRKAVATFLNLSSILFARIYKQSKTDI